MDREAAWNAYLAETFGALWERLDSENITHSTENTGGGCMVLFVRPENGHIISITPSENTENAWLVCHAETDEAFWNGESDTLDVDASIDRVVAQIRHHS